MKNFETALAHLFEVERGFVNHPADRGGPTNFGITLATLSSHRGETATAEDIERLTPAEATAIYLMRFWRPLNLDLIDSGPVSLIVFDQAVNRGPRAAIRALQAVLESTWNPGLGVDGVLGPKTLQAANAAPERPLALRLVVEAQRGYLDIWRANPSQEVFLAGWFARTWRLIDRL